MSCDVGFLPGSGRIIPVKSLLTRLFVSFIYFFRARGQSMGPALVEPDTPASSHLATSHKGLPHHHSREQKHPGKLK